MLALALGLLGAVVVVGAFCGGVFLGCWLCGEDGTPARAGRRPSRPAVDRKRGKQRRSFRDGYSVGYDDGYDTGYCAGFDAGHTRFETGHAGRETGHAGRDAHGGAEQRENGEKTGSVQAGESVSVQIPDVERDGVRDVTREDADGRDSVRDGGRDSVRDDRRDSVRDGGQKDAGRQYGGTILDGEREDVEEQAREAARRRRRLLDEQAAFRALQHYSAEHAYGLGSSGFDRRAGRSALD